MTVGDGEGPRDGTDHAADRCAEPGCQRPAAVRLYVPWAEDRAVCTGHARVIARQDGVVAEPMEGADWP